MTTFSKRLEKRRLAKGWTKTKTAKRLKIGLSTYANYEYGLREPDIKMLTLIANLFDTSTDYLLGKTDSPYVNDNQFDNFDDELDWTDFGMAYGGRISPELKAQFEALAKDYVKRHPEALKDSFEEEDDELDD
ncbi:Helix-turn-helix [Lactobacillus bombicola]|uniref:Helix-turn-helix n=1 Tax=Lactobacillus bombicola TaxID=1505723 RepID=A0A1I1TU70_9LACO|nr:helix-turn-helix domain-containing protein [Lactobacillus bombicola]SFD61945.1 Helix-turn-helix [Lactobacillus bombicola]